jgi:hypothetical protein
VGVILPRALKARSKPLAVVYAWNSTLNKPALPRAWAALGVRRCTANYCGFFTLG